jgi:phosphatidylinositol kinase/protein kinase (PI-3  family)
VLEWLRQNNPDKNAAYGVRKEAMDTYVKSVAGYCVVTYLLGVGDRHLDNLLLAPDGKSLSLHLCSFQFGHHLLLNTLLRSVLN